MNSVVIDPRLQREVLLGACNRAAFEPAPFAEWYQKYYNSYTPDGAQVAAMDLKSKKDLRILLVFGSWCGDSKREVPRFLRLLDTLDFPDKRLEMQGVGADKSAPGIDRNALRIERVPTFIFYRKDQEIGRIIESPQVSLEADMRAILEKY